MMSMFNKRTPSTASAKERLDQDPDIMLEARALQGLHIHEPALPVSVPGKLVPLNVIHTSHRASRETARICEEAGGAPFLQRFTANFYKKAFADPHLDQFIREHGDHHGERFAFWIAEKMGLGTPWTEERRTRPQCPFMIRDPHTNTPIQRASVHDRSSAHFAAWHSPKRSPQEWGEHFQVHDCRVWMRLHFWAAREEGLFNYPAFADYYQRFIGHFVSVYERNAPPFTRESARWSADPANIEAYLAAGRQMTDVMALKHAPGRALQTLPPSERQYTGSKAGQPSWPYDL